MSKTTFYQKNYVGFPPVKIQEFNDPDSYHWQNRANDMRHWLELKMGEAEFLEWVNRLFPDGDASNATWREIFDLFEAKFRVIQGEEREGCTCRPDSVEACPACKADSRRRHGNEIPF